MGNISMQNKMNKKIFIVWLPLLIILLKMHVPKWHV